MVRYGKMCGTLRQRMWFIKAVYVVGYSTARGSLWQNAWHDTAECVARYANYIVR